MANLALVVSEDTGLRELSTRALRERGWVVHQATSSDEALDTLSERSFDAVLLDDSLTDGGGVAVYNQLADLSPEHRPLLLVWTEEPVAAESQPEGLIYRQRSADPREPANAADEMTRAATGLGYTFPQSSSERPAERTGARRRASVLPLLGAAAGGVLVMGLVLIAIFALAGEPDTQSPNAATDTTTRTAVRGAVIGSPTRAIRTPTALIVEPSARRTPKLAETKTALPEVTNTPAPTTPATRMPTAPRKPSPTGQPSPRATATISATGAPPTATSAPTQPRATPAPAPTHTPVPLPLPTLTDVASQELASQVEIVQERAGGQGPVTLDAVPQVLLPYLAGPNAEIYFSTTVLNPRDRTLRLTGSAAVEGTRIPITAITTPSVEGGNLTLALQRLECRVCADGIPPDELVSAVTNTLRMPDLNTRIRFERVQVIQNALRVTASKRTPRADD